MVLVTSFRKHSILFKDSCSRHFHLQNLSTDVDIVLICMCVFLIFVKHCPLFLKNRLNKTKTVVLLLFRVSPFKKETSVICMEDIYSLSTQV